MPWFKRFFTVVIFTSLFVIVTGCEEKSTSEKVGDSLENAAETISDTADNVKNDVEDTCEKATGENC